jgi:hypothetical protein
MNNKRKGDMLLSKDCEFEVIDHARNTKMKIDRDHLLLDRVFLDINMPGQGGAQLSTSAGVRSKGLQIPYARRLLRLRRSHCGKMKSKSCKQFL